MKKIIFIVAVSLFSNLCFAQATEWQWGIGLEVNLLWGSGPQITTDASGNVYSIGVLEGTVDFDPGIGINNLGTWSGGIFIAKYSSSRNLIWAKQINSGFIIEGGTAIILDDQSNIYIAGNFSGTVDFDPGVDTFYLNSQTNNGVFFEKLDSGGNFIWVKNIDCNANNWFSISCIKLDTLNSVFIAGTFSDSIDVNPDSILTFYLYANGVRDIFISKFDSSGNFEWANSINGRPYDFDPSITLDNSGNVFITGTFQDTVDFDPGTATYNLISNGGDDIFILKLNTGGNFIWAKELGGNNSDNGFCITSDASGNIYTAGSFTGNVDFDPDSLTTFFYQTAGCTH